MKSNIRIYITKLNNHKSGFVCGRIISIDKNILFLSDITGISDFKFIENSVINFKEGDLVRIFYKKNKKSNEIKTIDVLNHVDSNPVIKPDTAYFKLNKNNKRLLNILKKKELFFQETRNFFKKNNFLEIHTPSLVDSPGIENYIEPFSTEYADYSGNKKKLYLPTSPEFSLKEALMSGLENIFEISKVYRNNGEKSRLHRPEFFMLEWYRAYCSYEVIMDDCCKLIKHLCKNIYKTKSIEYENFKCDFNKFKKIKVKDLFSLYDIDLDHYAYNENIFKQEIYNYYSNKNINISKELQKDDLFFKFFLDFIEPKLGLEHPVIVYEYPFEMAALSRRCDHDTLYAERFEIYICGIEIANAFGELIDPLVQENNFEKIIKSRNIRKTENLKMPEQFMQSLRYGIPPCSGIALGMERLFMLFENLYSISDMDLY